MKKHLLILFAALLSLAASAQDKVEIDGIWYYLYSESLQAKVTSGGSYTGSIAIPATVTYNGLYYSVTSIGNYAFSDCSSLTSIVIPASVTSIEEYAFCDCSSLTAITCKATTPPTTGGSTTFNNVGNPIPVYVPAVSVEAYKDAYPWSEFSNIRAIPSNAIAFGICGDNLTWRLTDYYELVIEGTGEMYNGSSWEGYEEIVKTITIREGVTSIGDMCFWNFSNLTVLTIPSSLEKIGGNPVYGCTKLYTILFSSGNPVYGNYEGNIVEKNSGTVVIGCRHVPAHSDVTKIGDFAYCGRGLSSIVIPKNITSIGYAAFSENEDMTSVTIPESVTSIGDHAFANCQKLTSVNIPEGVTKIGDWTFLQCYSLTSITIPSSVVELGNLAFGLCDNVAAITCKATTPPAAGNSFQRINSSIPVYVPAGSVEAYKTANDWKEFNNIVPISLDKCATPIISYMDGKFSLTCETEGAEVITHATIEGEDTFHGLEFEFTPTLTFTAYAIKGGFEDSDEVTLTLCWVPCTEEHENEEDGILTIPAKPVLISTQGGIITVSGLAAGTEVAAYSTGGTQLAVTTATDGTAILTTNLTTGDIAIVKIGERTVKVVMR